MRRAAIGIAASLALLAGCDDLVGLDPVPGSPLASVRVRLTGELDPEVAATDLRVSVLWLRPQLADPSCVPPAQSAEHAAVMAAGCTDPLAVAPGFSFTLEAAEVAADRTATLDLFALPDALFGDRYAQIAYASIVVYGADRGRFGAKTFVGASFTSMAVPDTRLAFRHGGFDDQLGFYPRRGCGAPPPGLSLLSAGGFAIEAAVEAQARGELPAQDPALCREDSLDRALDIALQPLGELEALSCFVFGSPSSPPPPTLGEGALTACLPLRDRAHGMPSDRSQALVAPNTTSKCRGLAHYVLRGCYDDPFCTTPDWDLPAPPWWPCGAEVAP